MPDPQIGVLPRRAFLRLAAAGSAAALAACSSSSRAPGTAASVKPGDNDVRSYGAVGDGRTDDTRAIQRALDALRPGQTLNFPAGGVFRHSSTIRVSTPQVVLTGPGRLLASAEQQSALQLEAAHVTLSDLTVSMGTTTQRWSAAEQHKIYIGSYEGITLRDVLVDGSAAAGVYAYGASGFHFERVTVRNTRADGIHMTAGSRRGVVDHPKISRSGDDGVAVVSYLQDTTPCNDIDIISPQVRTTTGGRGVSVVGGRDVRYRDIDVERSSAAGVYIACESGDFVTHPTADVTVSGGRIVGANTDQSIDHGAVLVYSGRPGGSVSDVTISDLTVSGTRSSCSRQIGVVSDATDDAVSDIVFRDLQLAAAPEPYQGDAPVADFRLDHVLADGVTVQASMSK